MGHRLIGELKIEYISIHVQKKAKLVLRSRICVYIIVNSTEFRLKSSYMTSIKESKE